MPTSLPRPRDASQHEILQAGNAQLHLKHWRGLSLPSIVLRLSTLTLRSVIRTSSTCLPVRCPTSPSPLLRLTSSSLPSPPDLFFPLILSSAPPSTLTLFASKCTPSWCVCAIHSWLEQPLVLLRGVRRQLLTPPAVVTVVAGLRRATAVIRSHRYHWD